MGHTSYCSTSRTVRAESSGYTTKSANEIFKSRNMPEEMDPKGVRIRESRDSDEHPISNAVMIALDVTGSMHRIPHHMIKEGLPHLIEKLYQGGVIDPQVLFTAVGDHEVDEAPLQIGQFETGDELMDKWLETVWIEGRGGSNIGESYLLPWYFAAHHIEMDCLEKRNQKGFLFTIGDEPTLNNIPALDLEKIMGPGQYQDYTASELLQEARKKFHVFHIHVKEGNNGQLHHVMDGWKQLIKKDLIIVDDYTTIPTVIAETIIKTQKKEGVLGSSRDVNKPITKEVNEPSFESEKTKQRDKRKRRRRDKDGKITL